MPPQLMKSRSFLRSGEQTLASYNWNDVQSGSGIVNFYGIVNDEDNSTKSYSFVTTPFYSSDTEIQGSTVSFPNVASWETSMDQDFDISFATPRTVQGRAYVTLYMLGKFKYNSSGTTKFRFYPTIRKWDGSSETDLTSTTDYIEVATTGSNSVGELISFSVDVPKTNFKIGETLRLTIRGDVYLQNHGAGDESGYVIIGTSPLDRDSTNITPNGDSVTTKFNFYVPFNIDL